MVEAGGGLRRLNWGRREIAECYALEKAIARELIIAWVARMVMLGGSGMAFRLSIFYGIVAQY